MDGFEDGLALRRAGEDGAGDEVGDLPGVGNLVEEFKGVGGRQAGQHRRGVGILEKGRAERKAEFYAVIEQLADLGKQGVHGEFIGGRGFKGPDALDAVGFVTDGFRELDAGDALQEEMGGAVLVLDGAADEAEAGDGGGGFAGAAGFLHGDGEHAGGAEGILEHPAVTGLENVERQERLRQQGGLRQGHDRDFTRQLHRLNLGQNILKARRDSILPSRLFSANIQFL